MSSGRPRSGSKGAGQGAVTGPGAVVLACLLARVPAVAPAGAQTVNETAAVLLPIAPHPSAGSDDGPVYVIVMDGELSAPTGPSEVVAAGEPASPQAAALSLAIEEAVSRDMATQPPEGWSAAALMTAHASAALAQLHYPLHGSTAPPDVPVPQEVTTAASKPATDPPGAPDTTATIESEYTPSVPAMVTQVPMGSKAGDVANKSSAATAGKAKPAIRSALGAKKKTPKPAAPSAPVFDNARARN